MREKKDILTVFVEKGEDDFLISEVLELPGCHTQAKTKEQLIERTKEAIRAYLERDDIPEILIKGL
ncbi:MAG: type II toxin-antitoxin system HicB family antitoxin [Nanoarchaeota archaeon]|nr:type II toxin-antitoxin system HicB family antitoxin [Nanoarchaeota archaeon]